MGRDEALAYGALAFFGDKYGEQVRVVEVPGFSKEFCGGTHVPRTGEIGLFLFTAEQGISAGTRRVEALTGEAAVERAQSDGSILEELEEAAKVDRRALVDEYARLREQLKARDREVQALKARLASGGDAATMARDAEQIAGALVWTPSFDDVDAKTHASIVDALAERNKDRPYAVVSFARSSEAVHVICAVSRSLTDRLKAPEVLKRLGVGGGGRAEFAPGGGGAPADVETARRRAGEVLRELLEAVRA
jgi:alanyl-tRNA synthetase